MWNLRGAGREDIAQSRPLMVREVAPRDAILRKRKRGGLSTVGDTTVQL